MPILSYPSLMLISQVALLGFSLTRMRKHGVGDQEVPQSIQSLTLFRDPSFLSPLGRRYRLLAFFLFISTAVSARFIQMWMQL